MIITLRIGKFNKFLKEGAAYLKSFPGAKAKQLNYHASPILSEHQYDAAVIHVKINSLLNV